MNKYKKIKSFNIKNKKILNLSLNNKLMKI